MTLIFGCIHPQEYMHLRSLAVLFVVGFWVFQMSYYPRVELYNGYKSCLSFQAQTHGLADPRFRK